MCWHLLLHFYRVCLGFTFNMLAPTVRQIIYKQTQTPDRKVSNLQAVTELNEAGTGTAPGLSVRDIRVHAHTRMDSHKHTRRDALHLYESSTLT